MFVGGRQGKSFFDSDAHVCSPCPVILRPSDQLSRDQSGNVGAAPGSLEPFRGMLRLG